MKIYSVAVIGGGFSGLCAANLLVKNGISSDSIIVLEGSKRVGKKILATGNGRGNITNAVVSADFYHGGTQFAAAALEKYSNAQLLEFFGELGLITCEENGRIYPASLCAGAICDVLRFALENKKIEVVTEFYVQKLIKNLKNGVFTAVDLNGREVCAKTAIIATGGKSGAGFLTDGRSYNLALGFGHRLTDLAPSLVQIKTEREFLRGLKGIKQEARVSLFGSFEKGGSSRFIKSFCGDVLFCDYGVSGNAIFSLSAYLKGVFSPTLKIQFLPYVGESELFKKLMLIVNGAAKTGGISLERLFVSVLPPRLSQALIKRAGFKPTDIACKNSVSAVNGLIAALILKIEGTLGFDSAQVTAGGIDLKDIGLDMQSKLEKGLYIIGEALDVDGDCGGYNLQWAFTSAAVCAENVAENLLK